MPFAPELLDELLKDNKTPEDPQTQVQLCMVHLLRSSLQYVSYKDRKEVASGLKTIYTAATELEAETALTDFEKKHSSRYAMIGKSWWANWMRIIPMYSYPAEIRRAIYTTNTIESLNMTLRKVIKTRASFPSDETAFKLLYLALQNISKSGVCP